MNGYSVNMKPVLNTGEYVFIAVDDIASVDISKAISFFKEKEAYTVIVEKHIADEWKQHYQYVAAWITLTVHSSLEAVGLTAAFSKVSPRMTLISPPPVPFE